MKLWTRFLPFMGWIGELRDSSVWRADLIAGITVALVLVPQSMAYAQLAGLPPYIGLYASFLPVIVASLFGSSRQLATGGVAVVSLMTAAALGPMVDGMGLQGDAVIAAYVSLAALLAIMVGVFQLSLGLFRLGVLVDFLSHPVVVGFTNGAAIIIATSQLNKIFGVERPKAEHSYEQVWGVVMNAISGTHILTFAMGVVALIIMAMLRKFLPKLPNVLIAVVVTTSAAYIMKYEEKGGGVVGVVPQGLPNFKLPDFDFSNMIMLGLTAVMISLIGFMEAISIAKAMAAQTRQRLDANQELVGQGLSNIFAGLFQAYPVSGSFSRSAVNISAGAITGFSCVVTGLVVMVTLLFLTPLLYHLPQATLAAVIIMAVFNLVKIEPIKHALKVHKADGVVAIVTFALTLILAPHVEFAIMVGVVLSLGLYLFRSMRPRVAVLSRHPDGTLRDADLHTLRTCDSISVVRFDGSLYFANTGYFEDKILDRVADKPNLKFIVIDAEGINEIDATGEGMLHTLADRLNALDIQMLVARAKKQVVDTFVRTGFYAHLGADHFFRTRTLALQHAWGKLGGRHEETCPLNVLNAKSEPQPAAEEAEATV